MNRNEPKKIKKVYNGLCIVIHNRHCRNRGPKLNDYKLRQSQNQEKTYALSLCLSLNGKDEAITYVIV